jgi:hypothetical protein
MAASLSLSGCSSNKANAQAPVTPKAQFCAPNTDVETVALDHELKCTFKSIGPVVEGDIVCFQVVLESCDSPDITTQAGPKKFGTDITTLLIAGGKTGNGNIDYGIITFLQPYFYAQQIISRKMSLYLKGQARIDVAGAGAMNFNAQQSLGVISAKTPEF